MQVLITLRLLTSAYAHTEADIIISQAINGYQNLVAGARKTGLFHTVYSANNRKTRPNKPLYRISRLAEIIRDLYYAIRFAQKKTYNELLFSNLSIFTILLFNILLRCNQQLRLSLFEDGISTYTKAFANADKTQSLHRRFVNHKGVLDQMTAIWLLRPELLQWQPPVNAIRQLPLLDANDRTFMQAVNTLFDAHNLKDEYKEKIIFFEESYFADGIPVEDVQIVQQLAQLFGKDNIIVKIHPRNPINRFHQLGFKTNTDIAIPWEVIMLNRNIADKILVTIASGAAVCPFLYCGIQTKTFSLMNCMRHKPGHLNSEMGQIMTRIYQRWNNVFFAPDSMEEFVQQVQSL